MTTSFATSHARIISGARRCVFSVLILLVLFPLQAYAQTTTTTAADGMTPSGLTPGAPAGSYPLSGFDNVNLFNGNLSFRLPLLNIGGRGNVNASAILALNTKSWKVKHYNKVMPDGNEINSFSPTQNNCMGGDMGYSQGRLSGRRSGIFTSYSMSCGYRYSYTLTRFTFRLPDGTEYELRDKNTGGQPLSVSGYACSSGPSRGTEFITADGTSATFISDTPVVENGTLTAGCNGVSASGYLLLRNGTRYRIDVSKITWVRDRNGNKLNFTYDAYGRVISIVDELNRQITINYDVSDVAPYGLSDQIVFKGSGGAQRVIRISKVPLANALRPNSGFSIQTLQQLFPELNNASSSITHNPTVVSKVWLPNSDATGQHYQYYQFFYNSYGELARVELPTGGATEYDVTPGSGVLTACQYCDEPQIYRRVLERRAYVDGTTLQGKTTYSASASNPFDPAPWTTTVTADSLASDGGLLARSKHYFNGSGLASLFQTYSADVYPDWNEGRENKTEAIDKDNPTIVLRQVTNTYQQRAPVSWWSAWVAVHGGAVEPPNDPRITTATISTEPSGANLVSKQAFGYDDTVPFNNQNNVKEYGFGTGAPGALVRETRTTFVTASIYTDATVGAHLRSLPTEVSVYDSGEERARSAFEYDNYSTEPKHANLINRPGISGFDGSFNTLFTTRGNVTATTNYLLTNGTVTGSIWNYAQYDIAGNVVKTIDAGGYQTYLYYADCFGGPDSNASLNSAPLELSSVGQASYAFATSATNALGHTSFTQFDYYTARPVNSEDPNGIVSSGYSNDLLDRTTKIIRAVNTSAQNQTVFAYDDVARRITTTSDLNDNEDSALVSELLYDGLGRTFETRQYEDAGKYIAVQQQYDALGRAFKTSKPFRPLPPDNETPIWTTTGFDALGRVKTVTTPDNAVVNTSYSGNTVTVTDQAGKARKSVTDALGRLKDVYEDPTSLNYQTSYSYDTLDNLLTVTQGAQTRTFVYDSLKRLTSATNPESGTICYGRIIAAQCQADGYDANGNLIYKTDARGVLTTNGYDALNRNTSVTYSDATPDTFRQYDLATNGKGRLNQAWQSGTTTSATYIDSYDALGRPLVQRQKFETAGVWSGSYQVSRTYNLAGGVTSQTYPSEHVVNYNYDAAGRLGDNGSNLAFTGNLGDGITRTYSQGVIYSPLGGMTKEQFGTEETPVYNKSFYNNRGQLAEIRLSTSYTGPTDRNSNRGAILNQYSIQCVPGSLASCNGTDNNGNIRSQDVFIPHNDAVTASTSWYQKFDYDELNRLQRVKEYNSAATQLWQQEYGYDRYGNRSLHQTNTWGAWINKTELAFDISNNNNRLVVPVGKTGTIAYDSAGNLTTDTYTGAGSRTYDAENRMTSAQGINQGNWQYYTYNGDGQRVRRKVDTVETWQIYGMDGELLAEYAASGATTSPQKEYGYRNGQLLVTGEAAVASGANVAAAANGASVSASSTLGSQTAANAINGDRKGLSSGWWADNTSYSYPDWLQVDFAGSKSINEINVIGLQQNYGSPVEPTLTMTSSYALTNFEVQYWTGSAWAAVPGGTVTGNDKVWRKLSFPTLTTSKIRLYVTSVAGDNRSQVVELEASGQAAFNWLVADHLGTPRMVLDKTGSLANMKRHDYLPFGEELYVGTGGRTSDLRYSGDTIRQKFTSKERDNETNLDYFLARYYSPTQGRFISADSFGGSQFNPQTLNLYSYVQNDPLNFIDPTGHMAEPWRKTILDYLYGPRVSDPMLGQAQSLPGQKPSPQKPATILGPKGEIPGDGDAVLVINSGPAFPGIPRDAPGDTIVERYLTSPVRTTLEVVDWASKGVRRFGYAVAPDYGYAGFNLPLMAGGQVQFSKDLHLYGSFNVFGFTGGNYENSKNWKLGLQGGAAYFATTEMSTQQRDQAIQGPAVNVTTGPVGGYFPLQGGPPAVTVGAPFTNLGVNVSNTKRIF